MRHALPRLLALLVLLAVSLTGCAQSKDPSAPAAGADGDADADADGDSGGDADGDGDSGGDGDADGDGDGDGDADADADGDADVVRDECADGTADCPAHSTCLDTADAYECECLAGYERNGFICLDIDECAAGDGGGCDPNADCQNQQGGFACTCRPGFEGDGLACADVDECAVAHGGCDAIASCTNLPGTFACACPDGWLGDGVVCRERGDTQVLNLDGSGGTTEVGMAATGLDDTDVWNTMSGAFSTDYTIDGLLWADGMASDASVHVTNLPGIWGQNPAAAVNDAMFTDYVYSWSGDSATLTFAGLDAGFYQVWGYAHEMSAQGNSGFSAAVVEDENGAALSETAVEYTSSSADWDQADWVEDSQYVVLDELEVLAGQLLRATVHAGGNGAGNAGCILNGLQLVRQ